MANNMENHFKLEEFYKPRFILPDDVKEKIEKYHIPELNRIREELNKDVPKEKEVGIIISKHSGYRPRHWEIYKGRSGNSQHCFTGKGAVDITCRLDMFPRLWELMRESAYTRVCLYPNKMFIHNDFKELTAKQEFICTDDKWEFQAFR